MNTEMKSVGRRVSDKADLCKAVLLATAITLSVLAVSVAGPAAAADESVSGSAVTRRITSEQYMQIVGDIFGPTVKFGGRFAPEARVNGLLAIGAAQMSVTASGLEQFDGAARTIATQVVDDAHRNLLIGCKPASATAPDDACAGKFLATAGRFLFRRPLTPSELQLQVSAASAATKTVKNFYTGLGLSLASLMDSPEFLFRQEIAESDPDHAGQYRLSAYSKASQLSFFLWNSEPDAELLAAAESGELNTEKGLSKQVDRMLALRRIASGVRAFFVDMLGLDDFDTLNKDATIYPKFTQQAAKDAKEQTLRTMVDLLVTRNGDYRDVFTTRKTFLTPSLGAIYDMFVPKSTANMALPEWVPVEYPENDPRAGILSEAAFSALHAHPGRSSPTIRGRALREIVLCQKVPDPPANVNFTIVQDTASTVYKTTRERLSAHRTDPVCAGCHKVIDPMGLAMENFDGSGAFRTKENGAPIDASGELDGVTFKDALGLGKAMHDSPAATACVVNRAVTYALGRTTVKGESDWVKSLEKKFAANGYKVPDLFRDIAKSPEFFRVSAPQVGALHGPASQFASQINPQQRSIR